MRRQAIIAALLVVGVGVVLGGTVFRTNIAQATGLDRSATFDKTATKVREQNLDGGGNIKMHEQGTAKVHEQGTVSVTTDPGQPVQADGLVDVPAGVNGGFEDLYTVPAGKRLVIQYVEGYVNYPTGADDAGVQLRITTGGSTQDWAIFTPNPAGATIGYTALGGAQQVTLYADAGTTVQMHVGRTGSGPNTSGSAALSGVLIDVP